MVNDLPSEVELARYMGTGNESWREGGVQRTPHRSTPLTEEQGYTQKCITKSAGKKVN